MRTQISKQFILFTILFSAQLLNAEAKSARWTEDDDKNADLTHVVEVLDQKTALHLTVSDFNKIEEKDLATSHYQMLSQVVEGIPVQGASLRLWTDLKTGQAIQVEAQVEDAQPIQGAAHLPFFEDLKRVQNTDETNRIALRSLANEGDNKPLQIVSSTRYWKNGELVQVLKIKARRGFHKVTISLSQLKVIEHSYKEFPQADAAEDTDEFNVPSLVFPIYEEPEQHIGQILPRKYAQLKYLHKQVRKGDGTDPYASLRNQTYTFDKFDPVLGLTDAGRAQGYWSMTYVKSEAAALRNQFPLLSNSYKSGGVILDGRYATVSIHPDALKAYPNIGFQMLPSLQFMPNYTDTAMVPTATLLGKPLLTTHEALERPARRLPDHDPASYINDGFDELQVYYSINTLVESLHSMGFTDPELSTRPFNAFLYNPDISMRDNAFYTDDTINFTTYSANAQNYARDNSTIWHELGHGIMDRLMGDSIVLADTGGLSEGMADFVASLVIADKMGTQVYPGMNDYRIINNTGFHLTNEVHDDGEAYGGTMDDIKKAAIAAHGRKGLRAMTDLTLETMRLTRNNPALTASGWFEHMLFADERGSSIRARGELHDLIVKAYSGRNFSLDPAAKVADFSLKNGDVEVTSAAPGSRDNPIPVTLADGEKATYNLSVSLTDGDAYKFQYPMTVKVFFNSGPLEGAIHWDGEENEPKTFTISQEGESIPFSVTANSKCDEVNREDGSCVDFAYVQIWNSDSSAKKPLAKKRFYLNVKAPTAAAR